MRRQRANYVFQLRRKRGAARRPTWRLCLDLHLLWGSGKTDLLHMCGIRTAFYSGAAVTTCILVQEWNCDTSDEQDFTDNRFGDFGPREPTGRESPSGDTGPQPSRSGNHRARFGEARPSATATMARARVPSRRTPAGLLLKVSREPAGSPIASVFCFLTKVLRPASGRPVGHSPSLMEAGISRLFPCGTVWPEEIVSVEALAVEHYPELD